MVVHSYYPHDETRVQREAEHLVARGWDVDLLCLRYGDEPRTATANGVRIRRLPVRRHRGSGRLVQLLEYLQFFVCVAAVLTARRLRWRYDVVHVHNLPDFLVFAALVPRLTGSRIVLDLHDLMPEFFGSNTGQGAASLAGRVLRLQERAACRFAHRVITVTDAWRETLVDRSVGAERCFVVRNVADARVFRPDVAPLPESGADGRFRLLYHGTVAERSGLDVVLDAVAQLGPDAPIDVVIVGRGPHLDAVVERAAMLGLSRRVEVHRDFLPVEEFARWIKGADCGIVPYRVDVFTDGVLPTKLLECAAIGVPVIASATSAIDATFAPHEVARFPAGDADALAVILRRLLADRHELAELGRSLHAWALANDWPSEAHRLEDAVVSWPVPA